MSRGEMKSEPRSSATPPKFVKKLANLYKPTSDGFVSKKLYAARYITFLQTIHRLLLISVVR